MGRCECGSDSAAGMADDSPNSTRRRTRWRAASHSPHESSRLCAPSPAARRRMSLGRTPAPSIFEKTGKNEDEAAVDRRQVRVERRGVRAVAGDLRRQQLDVRVLDSG